VVAIKRLLSSDASTVERFIAEVKILARLRHPNLILFMGFCTAPELCIISEYMNRGSLFSLLRQYMHRGQRLEARFQKAVAISVARGMNYLHSRSPPILHLVRGMLGLLKSLLQQISCR
jgi:serine/threonine protein kinase